MKKDKNSIDEILSAEEEQLIHKASEVQFNKDMEMFITYLDDNTVIPDLSNFDFHMYNKIEEMYNEGRKLRKKKLIFKAVVTSAVVIFLTFVFYPSLFGKVNAFF